LRLPHRQDSSRDVPNRLRSRTLMIERQGTTGCDSRPDGIRGGTVSREHGIRDANTVLSGARFIDDWMSSMMSAAEGLIGPVVAR
jgi:hypothetical protein